MTSKNKIKRIVIIGLGLIGGSLAKALKAKGYHITGITKRAETINLARKQKAIDLGFTKLNNKLLEQVDVVFICTPLKLISAYIKKISKLKLKKEIIVTDVGSTKSKICNFTKLLFSQSPALPFIFVGGHPMAGTEESGFRAAQIELFKKCAWVLTPLDDSEKTNKAIEVLQNLIEKIAAKPIITSPAKHDQAAALVSHLPLLASIGLCQMLKNLNDPKLCNLATMIASSGFRDMTRISGGNPEMNLGLLSSNLLQIKSLLPKYYKELETIIKLVNKEPSKLHNTLTLIHEWRSKLYNPLGKNINLL